MDPAPPAAVSPPPRRALVGWRLLALAYDLFPAAALWFLVATAFVVVHGDAVTGGALGLLEFAALWLVTGAYAVASWRRGGQTLGMRAWRLRVTDRDGNAASVRALVLRYVAGTVSLLPAGAGFWWAWLDRDRLALHDRASGTRMTRLRRR